MCIRNPREKDTVMSDATIRVLIADDQALVREGLALIAGSAPDIEVVGHAVDGLDAVESALRLRPDVVLMDVRMPNMDGIEATEKLLVHAGEADEIRVLALTTYDSEDFALRMLEAGASGFLLKDAPGEQLLHAIRTVAGGSAIMEPQITRALVARAHADADTSVPEALVSQRDAQLAQLTAREREVLELLVEGESNASIAASLFLAEVTVKAHVGRILDKLGVPDRIHVVIWAYETGFISPAAGRS